MLENNQKSELYNPKNQHNTKRETHLIKMRYSKWIKRKGKNKLKLYTKMGTKKNQKQRLTTMKLLILRNPEKEEDFEEIE